MTLTLTTPAHARAAVAASAANRELRDLVEKARDLAERLRDLADAHGPDSGCRCAWCRHGPARYLIADVRGAAWACDMAASALDGETSPLPDDDDDLPRKG